MSAKRISPEEIARQRQFCAEVRNLNEGRPGGPPRACIQTYGCQQNEADSELLRGMLREKTLIQSSNPGKSLHHT